jgi:hypothetical protein
MVSYLRMSSVLLNTSILEIYGLWKSGEIVLLTNRSQYVFVDKSLAVRFIVYL